MEKFSEGLSGGFRETLERAKGHGISELLWYHTESRYLFIHLSKNEELSFRAKWNLYLEGLSELAKRLDAQKDLEGIVGIMAISKITKEHPKLLEKQLGFHVIPKEGESVWESERPDWKTGITTEEEGTATMSRNEFVERYKKNKK